jgi:hypothetical protein
MCNVIVYSTEQETLTESRAASGEKNLRKRTSEWNGFEIVPVVTVI